MKKLHLGCGSNYLKGWINVDLDAACADVHADLRDPLSHDDASVDFIFNEHFIEHLTRQEGILFLKECYRVLRPGGIIRLSTPDLRWLIAQYIAGKLDEWLNVSWVPRSACQMMNEGMRLWGHQFLYDLPELAEVLYGSGFTEIVGVAHRASNHPELVDLECRPFHQELIVEARR